MDQAGGAREGRENEGTRAVRVRGAAKTRLTVLGRTTAGGGGVRWVFATACQSQERHEAAAEPTD